MPALCQPLNKTLKRTGSSTCDSPNKKLATENSLLGQYIRAVLCGPDHHSQLDVEQVVASFADMDPEKILTGGLLKELDAAIDQCEFATDPLRTIQKALSQRVLAWEPFFSVEGTKRMARFLDTHKQPTLRSIATTRMLDNIKEFSDDDAIHVLKFITESIDFLQQNADVKMDDHLQVLAAIVDRWIPAMEPFVAAICKILRGAPNVRATKIVAMVVDKLSVQQLVDHQVFDSLTCADVERAWQFDTNLLLLFEIIKRVDAKISSVEPTFVPRHVIQVIKLLDIQIPSNPQYKSYCVDLCKRLRLYGLIQCLRSFLKDTIVDNLQPDGLRLACMEMYTGTLGFKEDDVMVAWGAVEAFCRAHVIVSISFQFGVFLARMVNETAKRPEPRTFELAVFQLTTIKKIRDDLVFARVVQLMVKELCATIEALLGVDLSNQKVAKDVLQLVCATLRHTRVFLSNKNEPTGRMLAVLHALGILKIDRTQCLHELRHLVYNLVDTDGDKTLFAITLGELGNLLAEIDKEAARLLILDLFTILMDLPPSTHTQELVAFIALHAPKCFIQRDIAINQLPTHVMQMVASDTSVDYGPLMQAFVNVPVEEPLACVGK